jgi:hypothetical protein
MKKLKLVYIPYKNSSCIQQPHYDLCTNEKEPCNIACILTNKKGADLIGKWVKLHNKEIK